MSRRECRKIAVWTAVVGVLSFVALSSAQAQLAPNPQAPPRDAAHTPPPNPEPPRTGAAPVRTPRPSRAIWASSPTTARKTGPECAWSKRQPVAPPSERASRPTISLTKSTAHRFTTKATWHLFWRNCGREAKSSSSSIGAGSSRRSMLLSEIVRRSDSGVMKNSGRFPSRFPRRTREAALGPNQPAPNRAGVPGRRRARRQSGSWRPRRRIGPQSNTHSPTQFRAISHWQRQFFVAPAIARSANPAGHRRVTAAAALAFNQWCARRLANARLAGCPSRNSNRRSNYGRRWQADRHAARPHAISRASWCRP